MSDVSRVTLWQGFGVPIFELYLGPDNGLLAAECGAHEGWHLEPGIDCWRYEDELILDSPWKLRPAHRPRRHHRKRRLSLRPVHAAVREHREQFTAWPRPRRLAASA